MFWWPDPGPCPVDDAPHTTCTSPDYSGQPIVIQQMPMRDAMTPGWSNNPVAAPAPEVPPSAPFTTKTYRRTLHHPARAKK